VFALETSRAEYFCYTSEQKEKELILGKTQEDKTFLGTLKSM
jgi:hypothetical protein